MFVFQKPLKQASTPVSSVAQTYLQQLGEKYDFRELQRTADYFLIKKVQELAKWFAYGLIATLGPIALARYHESYQFTFTFFILTLLGGFVLFMLLIAVICPSARIMVLQGIIAVLVGVVQFCLGIISSIKAVKLLIAYGDAVSQGGKPRLDGFMQFVIGVVFLIFFGLYAFVWGLLQFSRYVKFRDRPIEKPEGIVMERVKNIAKSIDSTEPETSSNIIKFTVPNSPVWHGIWKGELSENRVVFVKAGLEDIIFSEKQRVRITQTYKDETGITRQVKFEIGKRICKGSISTASLERFQQWKKDNKS